MKKTIYELIDENKKLIYKIASTYSKNANIEDLFQVGCIGLINAYKNFKNDFNTKFSTYAYTYILGEITSYLRNDRLVKVGTEAAKMYKIYEKAKDYLTNLKGYIPSTKEIAEFMEVSEFDLYNSISNNYLTESLDKEIAEDLSLQEIIGTDEREKIDEKIDLFNILNGLSVKERDLINYRYYKDYTQSETAALMGITQVQVSREENKILKRMKKEMVR